MGKVYLLKVYLKTVKMHFGCGSGSKVMGILAI